MFYTEELEKYYNGLKKLSDDELGEEKKRLEREMAERQQALLEARKRYDTNPREYQLEGIEEEQMNRQQARGEKLFEYWRWFIIVDAKVVRKGKMPSRGEIKKFLESFDGIECAQVDETEGEEMDSRDWQW
jgi:hypothetical protein